MSRTRRRALFGVVWVALVASSAPARADGPTLVTDAFYVGVSPGPGAALSVGWDLDVYLSRDRAISVGPAVHFTVLRSGEPDLGEQNFSLWVDAVRFKVGLNEPGDNFRPAAVIGAGFMYVDLAASSVSVTVLPDGAVDPITGVRTAPGLSEFAPTLVLGGSMDLFAEGNWGFSALMLTRYRLSGTERLPVVSAELSLGIRFGF